MFDHDSDDDDGMPPHLQAAAKKKGNAALTGDVPQFKPANIAPPSAEAAAHNIVHNLLTQTKTRCLATDQATLDAIVRRAERFRRAPGNDDAGTNDARAPRTMLAERGFIFKQAYTTHTLAGLLQAGGEFDVAYDSFQALWNIYDVRAESGDLFSANRRKEALGYRYAKVVQSYDQIVAAGYLAKDGYDHALNNMAHAAEVVAGLDVDGNDAVDWTAEFGPDNAEAAKQAHADLVAAANAIMELRHPGSARTSS